MFRWLYKLADQIRHQLRLQTWHPAHALGRRGEDLAHRYLQKKGFVIVARNYKTPSGAGELDIVARANEREDSKIVVVEVKSRTSSDFHPPQANVTRDKQHKLLIGADDFARRAGVPMEQVRFDVVSVVFEDPVRIEHLENVFHTNEIGRRR